MSNIRFPYDLPSEEALVELVRRDRPQDDVRSGFVKFGDLFFSPTPQEPGRTFVEMDNLRTGKKSWYTYRRLDIDRVLSKFLPEDIFYISVGIEGVITPAKIVAEINKQGNLKLNGTDTSVSERPLTTGNSFIYTMAMHTDSFAYYGQVVIYVNTTPIDFLIRISEDGRVRTLESGYVRKLEG